MGETTEVLIALLSKSKGFKILFEDYRPKHDAARFLHTLYVYCNHRETASADFLFACQMEYLEQLYRAFWEKYKSYPEWDVDTRSFFELYLCHTISVINMRHREWSPEFNKSRLRSARREVEVFFKLNKTMHTVDDAGIPKTWYTQRLRNYRVEERKILHTHFHDQWTWSNDSEFNRYMMDITERYVKMPEWWRNEDLEQWFDSHTKKNN